MQLRLGLFLRQLRQFRSLSQTQAAQGARIGRVTLSRWENDTQRPRAVELDALLTAFKADSHERRQAFALLGQPEPRFRVQSEVAPVDEIKKIGPQPHGGEMLRALRIRRGFSQEDAAKRASVGIRTLRRWEKGEIWPSIGQIHALCHALNAHSQEVWALTTGGLSFEPISEESSLEEIYERCDLLNHYPYHEGDHQGAALRELGFFALEMQVWPFAIRSVAGQQVLARIYTCHANYYSSCERYAESNFYAHRALDSFPSTQAPEALEIQAGIISAVSVVYQGAKPAPQRGIEIMKHWLDEVRGADYKSWMLSEVAKYLFLSGHREEGLALAKTASDLAAQCQNPYELLMRRFDEAKLLVSSGRSDRASHLLQSDTSLLEPGHLVNYCLLEAEACLNLQEPSRAHDKIQNALRLIETWKLEYLLPYAQELTHRF